MAIAEMGQPVIGSFVSKETNAYFEYSDQPILHNQWAIDQGATHVVYVCDVFCNTRAACVLKTVVYIGVDEDENGNMVWEKWPIKQHRLVANG